MTTRTLFKPVTLAVLLGAAWICNAAAQDQSEALLGETSVSATRSERLLDLTPKPVTVVSREQIILRPLSNVQQILGDTPGISYSRSGGLGGQLVVRGLNSNDPRMVLFIDGDRFRGRNTLEYNLLDPSEIERVEIVRGPGSALYGSDAMAGVVNVITRRAQGDPFQDFKLTPRIASLGYDSASDLRTGRVELVGLGGGVDALIGVNARNANSYESPRGLIPNSDFESATFTSRIGYSFNTNSRIELISRVSHAESGRAGGIAGAPGSPLLTLREDPISEDYYRIAYTHKNVTSWLDGLEASFYRREIETVINTVDRTAANGNVAFRNSYVLGPVLYGGKLIGRSAVGKTLLTYGGDFFLEDRPGSENDARTFNAAGTQIATTVRAKRNRDATQLNAGTFINADWDPSPQWTFSAAARYDTVKTEVEATPAVGENPALIAAFARNQSATDSAVTGGIGAIFRPWQTLHLVANAANSFRAPATFEKFGSSVAGAVTTVPNPDLKPETSINYEAGFRVRLKDFSLNITGFISDFEDLIQTVTVNATTRQRQNTGKARLAGAELDGLYSLTRMLGLRFNASHVRGTNSQTQQPLAYVPPLNGLVALRYGPSADFIELGVRGYAAKDRIDPTQERNTAGYATVSLSGGIDLARVGSSLKGYRLTMGIENLFDKAYVNPVVQQNIAFPLSNTNPLLEPGRSFFINFTGKI